MWNYKISPTSYTLRNCEIGYLLLEIDDKYHLKVVKIKIPKRWDQLTLKNVTHKRDTINLMVICKST